MHGHDDRADGGGGEQQGDDLKRQHVTADKRDADVVHGDGRDGILLWNGAHAREHSPSENGKDAGGDDQAHEPGRAEDAAFRQFGAAREQNGEDNKDGDGADVDQNLREAGELRVELQKQAAPVRRRPP